MKPTLGRIVLVMCQGFILPAIIVKVWSDTCINVVAFNDGTNDLDHDSKPSSNENSYGVKWLRSYTLVDNLAILEDGEWCWPPKVEQTPAGVVVLNPMGIAQQDKAQIKVQSTEEDKLKIAGIDLTKLNLK